jgi:hypothetical protein
MRRTAVVAVALTGLFFVSFLVGRFGSPGRGQPEGPPPAPAAPQVQYRNRGFDGRVTAVTDRSISIFGIGMPGMGGDSWDPEERHFVASDLLAAGGFDALIGYRLSDVCVGDIVSILYDRIDGIDICVSVRIRRRPGGRIPPCNLPGCKCHEYWNAIQNWEERGIPLPPEHAPAPPQPAPGPVGVQG